MKKSIIGIFGLLMAVCLNSCSKDAEGIETEAQNYDKVSGIWYFEEELTPGCYSRTGVEMTGHADTKAEEKQVNMYYQTINILADGSFDWIKRFYYPNVWLFDQNTWGEREQTYECNGKIELSDEKISFAYDKWFMGSPGIVFTYQLSADGQQLILHGLGDGFQPLAYELHFYKK